MRCDLRRFNFAVYQCKRTDDVNDVDMLKVQHVRKSATRVLMLGTSRTLPLLCHSDYVCLQWTVCLKI